MFNLNESMRYLLYNKPTDMRKSFRTLGGIVRNAMGCDPTNGDVYIFMNKQRNRIKLLHWERGGMVLLLETAGGRHLPVAEERKRRGSIPDGMAGTRPPGGRHRGEEGMPARETGETRGTPMK